MIKEKALNLKYNVYYNFGNGFSEEYSSLNYYISTDEGTEYIAIFDIPKGVKEI